MWLVPQVFDAPDAVTEADEREYEELYGKKFPEAKYVRDYPMLVRTPSGFKAAPPTPRRPAEPTYLAGDLEESFGDFVWGSRDAFRAGYESVRPRPLRSYVDASLALRGVAIAGLLVSVFAGVWPAAVSFASALAVFTVLSWRTGSDAAFWRGFVVGLRGSPWWMAPFMAVAVGIAASLRSSRRRRAIARIPGLEREIEILDTEQEAASRDLLSL